MKTAQVLAALALAGLAVACGEPNPNLVRAAARPQASPAGAAPGLPVHEVSAVRGARLITQFGCGSCHVIPGIAGADGKVGPPLLFWAQRIYIAGQLPNTPENLVRWLMNPPAVEPGTAMPDMGVGELQARDIAAYLYTLD